MVKMKTEKTKRPGGSVGAGHPIYKEWSSWSKGQTAAVTKSASSAMSTMPVMNSRRHDDGRCVAGRAGAKDGAG